MQTEVGDLTNLIPLFPLLLAPLPSPPGVQETGEHLGRGLVGYSMGEIETHKVTSGLG